MSGFPYRKIYLANVRIFNKYRWSLAQFIRLILDIHCLYCYLDAARNAQYTLIS